jgi:hypothetical protein
MVVTDVRLSCECTKIEPKAYRIPPNGETTALATVDLTHRSPSEIGKAFRPLDLTFAPVGQHWERPEPTRLRGTIRSRATSNRLDLHFGEGPVKGQPPVSRSVVVSVHVPFRAVVARTEPDLAATVVKRQGDTATQLVVVVTPRLELEPSSYTSKLIVSVIDETGMEKYGFTIPVSFDLLPSKPLFPRRVYLPTGRVGSAIEAQIEASADAGQQIAIEAVESNSEELAARVDPEPMNSVPSVVVIVTPKKQGPGQSTVTVAVRDVRTSQRQRVPVEVIYAAE